MPRNGGTSVDASSTPSPNGSYSVTLQVPPDFPPTNGALLSVDCSDASQVGVHFTRGRGQSVPVEDITPTTLSTTIARPTRELPRTGATQSTPWLLLSAVALLAAGSGMVGAARRRRQGGP